jgi:SNF-related kinase
MSEDNSSTSLVLSKYTLHQELSSSKYSILLASTEHDSKTYALKVFPANHSHFIQESSILSSLSHPNIITFNEINPLFTFQNQTLSFIALEFAKFGDFFEILSNRGPMSTKLVRTIFHQLVNGVEHMHKKCVAHMDLKLENLLLADGFSLKITDFDLSMKIEDSFGKQTGRGTPGYRAPEVKNETCTDLMAADVYSMGIILFSLVTGNPPYNEVEGENGLQFDKYYKLLREDPENFWRV